MHILLYRTTLAIILAAAFHPVLAQDRVPFMSFRIATRLVENGKSDNDRLFLFDFSYSDLDPSACSVQTLVIHNLQCSSNQKVAVLPSTALWTSQSFCDQRHCGGDLGFACTRQALGDERFEFRFSTPEGLSGRGSHRFIMQLKPYKILEYSGSLSNYSDTQRTIKAASYVPITSPSGRWLHDVNVGCSKIAVPAIPAK